ncbi:hypothetical protein [Niallia sp. Marseille-Q9988]
MQKKSFWAITYFKRLHNLAEGDEKKGADTENRKSNDILWL